MLEIMLMVALGFLFGVLMGLAPGIHPNMIVLTVPLISALGLDVPQILAFIVAMGVTNSVVSFIPSILLGAPEAGNEYSVLPGHRMLLSGQGYDAVKLTVVGSIGGLVLVILLLPLLALVIPYLYGVVRPYIHVLLILISSFMIITEEGGKKIIALFVFLLSGFLGITMNGLPLNNVLILFPVFSGFFGVGILLIQLRKKGSLPKQKNGGIVVSGMSVRRSVVFGSVGGIVSGFLPGVGSSEISTLASRDKNDKSFLMTIGAITAANVILSILSLWLISQPRSGLAVAINQLTNVALPEILLIIAVAMVCIGIASVATLRLTKLSINFINKIDYSYINVFVVAFIVILTSVFTGPVGLLLLLTCTALGVFVNLCGIRRGNLMGVLILPTILFYAGF